MKHEVIVLDHTGHSTLKFDGSNPNMMNASLDALTNTDHTLVKLDAPSGQIPNIDPSALTMAIPAIVAG